MDDNVNSDCALRDAAENQLGRSRDVPSELKDTTPEAIIHELQVHQVELEMQNQELHRAQVEAERSRERYLDLFDYAPVGYFTLDKNAVILEANLTGAGLLGIERISLIDKPLTSFIHKDDQDTFYLHRNQVLQTETQHICEIKLVKSRGGWFHSQLQSVRMADPKGGPGQWRTAITDITDRKLAEDAVQSAHDELENRVEERTSELLKINERLNQEIAERKKGEEALRRSEERYRQLFEKNRAIKLLVDPETAGIVDANPSALEFYGYSLEEIKQLKITDINILAAEQVAAAMTAIETEEGIASFVFRHRLSSGEIRDVEVHSGPIEIHGRNVLYSIIHDITERKKAEEALRESELRLNLALSGAGLGSWDYNVETGETICDQRLAEMLGFPLDQIQPHAPWWENLTHPD
ncbi:MAG: PAS domain-containing protein, partial [Desulfomonilaceae bacterium]